MEFYDEKIIKARKEMEEVEKARHSEDTIEEELKQSIYDEEIRIFKVPVQFDDWDVLEEKAVLRMPKDFVARSEEEIESVYFLGNKPQYVYSNSYLTFMIALNWTPNLIPDENIHDFTEFAKTAIERVGSKSRIMKVTKRKRPDGNLAILEFLAHTIESANYNVMFFASVEKRLLIGSITFEEKYSKRLITIAREIAESFHVKQEEEAKAE